MEPFGPNGTFIKAVGDMGGPVNCDHNFTAKISPLGIPHYYLSSLISNSWIQLCFLHPSPAAYPNSPSTNLVYIIPSSEGDLQEWASKTSTVISNAECADEVIADTEPSALTKLYFVLQTNEIVPQPTYWRTNGIGVYPLMCLLVGLIANLPDVTSNKIGTKTTWYEF